MDTRFLAATVVKLFAVYLGIQVIDSIAYTFMTQSDYGLHENRLLLDALVIATKALLAIILWLFPQTVIKSILRTENQHPDSAIMAKDLAVAACMIIGLFMFVHAAIDAVYWLFFLHHINDSQGFQFLNPDQKTAIVVTPIEFIVGLLLTFGGRGLIGLIYVARSAGHRR